MRICSRTKKIASFKHCELEVYTRNKRKKKHTVETNCEQMWANTCNQMQTQLLILRATEMWPIMENTTKTQCVQPCEQTNVNKFWTRQWNQPWNNMWNTKQVTQHVTTKVKHSMWNKYVTTSVKRMWTTHVKTECDNTRQTHTWQQVWEVEVTRTWQNLWKRLSKLCDHTCVQHMWTRIETQVENSYEHKCQQTHVKNTTMNNTVKIHAKLHE